MIVVTGAGVISAIGNNKAEVLNSLIECKGGIGRLQYLDTSHTELPCGEVKLSNAQMREMIGGELSDCTRTSLLGIIALREALGQAGISPEESSEMALISGTTVGSMDKTERDFLSCGSVDVIGDCETSTLQMASRCGSFKFITTCSTACSSAANAFVLGAHLIECGLFERVVVGGTECISKFHLNGFNSLMILDNRLCRPFDATRAGLNLGEGAGFMVLESIESATKRGVTPLAVLSGWGNACDAFHQTATSPEGEGGYLSMRKALDKAGLEPLEIDYINAHGTSTPNNDSSESTAIIRLFGNQYPPVSSTKSMTGHTTSASGGIEMVICLLAMQSGIIPVNLNWNTPMEEGIVPVSERMQNRCLKHILCNSFGFGGNDTSLILSSFEAEMERRDAERYSRKIRPEALKIYIKCVVRHNDIPAEEMPKIPPLIARRLKGLLFRALTTSLVAIERTGIPHPDAIITGTAMGCVDETLTFLKEIWQNGEQLLKPTAFMNSTHNTIGSLIAIRTASHGYNNTYSQGNSSLKSAMLDAMLQISLGEIENALVGLYDQWDEKAIALVLTKEPEGDAIEINIQNLNELCGKYSL